jgi:hypothetical protein
MNDPVALRTLGCPPGLCVQNPPGFESTVKFGDRPKNFRMKMPGNFTLLCTTQPMKINLKE